MRNRKYCQITATWTYIKQKQQIKVRMEHCCIWNVKQINITLKKNCNLELARKTNTDSHKIQVRRREFGNDISRPGILYGIKHTHDFLHAVSVYSFIFSSSDSVTFSHYFATVVVKMLYFGPPLWHYGAIWYQTSQKRFLWAPMDHLFFLFYLAKHTCFWLGKYKSKLICNIE